VVVIFADYRSQACANEYNHDYFLYVEGRDSRSDILLCVCDGCIVGFCKTTVRVVMKDTQSTFVLKQGLIVGFVLM